MVAPCGIVGASGLFAQAQKVMQSFPKGFPMIDASEGSPRPKAPTHTSTKVRDVADFHSRWPEFRPLALGLGQSARLTRAEADTLSWMIAVLDRIGPKDLEDGQG